MLKMHRGSFKIATHGGTEERKGIFNDTFGIHGNKYGYTITHIPSGLLTAEANSQAEAKQKCEQLFALPVDWKVIDPFSGLSSETRDEAKRIAFDR